MFKKKKFRFKGNDKWKFGFSERINTGNNKWVIIRYFYLLNFYKIGSV